MNDHNLSEIDNKYGRDNYRPQTELLNLKDSFRMDPQEQAEHQNAASGTTLAPESQQAGQAFTASQVSPSAKQHSLFSE